MCIFPTLSGSLKMPDLLTLQPISPRHLVADISSPIKTGRELPDYVAKLIRCQILQHIFMETVLKS